MDDQEITLNIFYNMHEDDWAELHKVYRSMPGWIGFESEGCAYWFGKEEGEKHIHVSIEPSGLVISGFITDDEWEKWVLEFAEKASVALEYEVTNID